MTLYLSNRDGNGKTNEEGHYKLPLNAWNGTVLNAAACLVTQQSPLALGVKIAPGEFKILDTSNNFSFSGWNSADLNVTITTADPANPRISSIVLYVDKGAATSASPPNNPGIVKAVAVNGTPGAVPVAPNGATIQSAVGAGNPYIVLANATVAAAGTTVANAAISDQRVIMTVATNMVNTAAIQDNSISTVKIQDSAITDTKILNGAVTTRKVKPTYIVMNGNNGASRQTFPSANTTYSVVGTSTSYTSGPTNEILDISGTGLCNPGASGAGAQLFIAVGGTAVSKSHYFGVNNVHATGNPRCLYPIAANTTVTIDLRYRTVAAGGEICNSASDQSNSPSFGSELRIVAWGRT